MDDPEIDARLDAIEARIEALELRMLSTAELLAQVLADADADDTEVPRDLDGNTLAPRAPCNLHDGLG